MSLDTYDGRRPGIGVSYDFNANAKPSQRRWRNPEDQRRISNYNGYWGLFKGKHYIGDGGIWPHPYGDKGKAENILYQQINLLSKASRVFADLIVGEGIVVTSQDKGAQAIIDNIDFRGLWESLLMASVFGFVGLQPSGESSWSVIKPHYLYPEFNPSKPGVIARIVKVVPFLEVGHSQKIDLIYEETHTKESVETHLYQIRGEYIVQELDLGLYTTLIDPEEEIPVAFWQHNLGDFLISLLYNEKIEDEVFSDYTISALRSQESLNAILTQIDRILKFHGNPKLIVPQGSMVKDPNSDRWIWAHANSEVLVHPTNEMSRYEYLTWDGQLREATERKNDLLSSLHTELDIAPQLTTFMHLMSGTVAETAAKLKKMLHATIKRAGRKREWAWYAIESLIKNILTLNGIVDGSFSIEFPEMIPQGRDEIIDEVVIRKQTNLIGTVDALRRLDNLGEEEATEKAATIFNEAANAVQNPFQQGVSSEYFPPVDDGGVE